MISAPKIIVSGVSKLDSAVGGLLDNRNGHNLVPSASHGATGGPLLEFP